jgi:RND family efflux transporter MFP subunit
MKKYMIGIIIIATIIFYGCNSNSQNNTHSHEGHEHVHDHEHEGHDHDHEGDDHDHEGHEGHNHESEDHDHEGHDHEHDGHNHEGHEEHPDEIQFSKKQAETVGLEIEILKQAAFINVIKTGGQIQASQGDEITIVSTTNGVVTFSNSSISDGTAVKTGETVVTISAKNLLEGDPAAKAKIEYETAQKEYNRAEELVKDKIISAKEFEQTNLRYQTAKTAYDAQSARVTSNGSIKISSTINGYVKKIFVNQGEYVVVGQPLVTISQNKRLQLRAEVSEKYFKDLKSIVSANFKPAYEDKVYKLSDLNGRLASFGKTSNQQSFYIPVIFEFDNVGDIISGSFIEVYLLSTVRENALTVPLSAITEEQGLYFVYLQLSDEEYKKQEVTLGHNDGERALVLSGLDAGDKIVTKGVYQVKLAANSSVIPEGHGHSH